MHLETCFKKPFTKKEIKAVKIFYKKINTESHTDIIINTS